MGRAELFQVPVTSIAVWDSIRYVEAIIDEADSGYFYNAAYLAERVMRDDRIYSVMMTRIHGLLGKHLDFDPGKDTARARKIAEEIEVDWPLMFEHSALVRLMTWGLMLGVGVAQIIDQGDRWSLSTLHPHSLRWDILRRNFKIQMMVADQFGANGEIIASHPEEFLLVPDGQGGYVDAAASNGSRPRRWVVFTPFGYEDAGRYGLLNKLGRLFVSRQEPYRDRSRYSEKHGNPMHLGIAPVNATTEEVNEFARRLDHIDSEPVVVARQGEDGNKWDIRLIEAVGKSHELFLQTIEQISKDVADVVLGQSQTTDGQAGLGSNDQAGELVRLDIMRADKDALVDTLRAQVLVPYCEFAYGSGDLAPWPCWQVDPPEDKAARAKVHLDQANADNVYVQAGVLTPEEVALSRFGKGDGEYSLDTDIDVEARQAIKDLSAKQMQIEAEKALEQAQNPTPPLPSAARNGASNGASGMPMEMPPQ